MAFDPISHASGFGAGQSSNQRALGNARLNVMDAEFKAKQERAAKEALQAEIQNKWIPYGIRLQSSIMANRVQKDDLIAALKASNPENVDHIVQESEKHADVEYDRLGKSGSKELAEVNEIVKREAEAGRLDK